MISIGFLFIYFLKGGLPWQRLHGDSIAEKYKLIQEKKENTSFEELCSDLPGKAELLVWVIE
jgi:casein kinase 1